MSESAKPNKLHLYMCACRCTGIISFPDGTQSTRFASAQQFKRILADAIRNGFELSSYQKATLAEATNFSKMPKKLSYDERAESLKQIKKFHLDNESSQLCKDAVETCYVYELTHLST